MGIDTQLGICHPHGIRRVATTLMGIDTFAVGLAVGFAVVATTLMGIDTFVNIGFSILPESGNYPYGN